MNQPTTIISCKKWLHFLTERKNNRFQLSILEPQAITYYAPKLTILDYFVNFARFWDDPFWFLVLFWFSFKSAEVLDVLLTFTLASLQWDLLNVRGQTGWWGRRGSTSCLRRRWRLPRSARWRSWSWSGRRLAWWARSRARCRKWREKRAWNYEEKYQLVKPSWDWEMKTLMIIFMQNYYSALALTTKSSILYP